MLAAEGALLGALIGDAAGAALEFKERVTEQQLQAALGMNGGGPFRTAPGQVTDDGELAMALAWGLVEGGGRFDLDAIAAYAHTPTHVHDATACARAVTYPRGAEDALWITFPVMQA